MATSRTAFTAKVRPPSAHGLVRERLVRLATCQVGLVVAPAGHGKTTLLGHVAAAFDGPVAWYRADGGDRAEAALLARLGPTVGKALGRDLEVRTREDLVSALDGLTDRMLLVVDDFHEIAGTPGADTVLAIVATRPPALHVLIGARGDADLDLSHLRMSDDVVVVDAEDLRFRSWEVERLFRDVYRRPLRPEDAATLTARTEGWAAGLTMFDLMTRSRSPAARRAALSEMMRGSRLVRGYLVREVLSELPGTLRDFLRRSSALGVLSAQACDVLLDRSDSQEVLEDLERRQLFTTSDDEGRRFRYHQVLQDHLELELTEQLGSEGARAWYRRAAALLQEQGEARAAFRALVRAQDWEGVQRILREHGADVVERPVEVMAEPLPAALRERDPWLVLAAARMLTTRGALTRAVAAYQAAQSLTLDDEVRALCDRERQAVALWLPGARPQPTTPAGALRAATRQAPGRLVDACLAMPGADGVLAAGIALLLSGHPEEALQVFRRAAAHPGADSRVLDLTACATAAAQLLMAPPAAAGPPPEGPGRPSGAGDGRPDRSAASGTADQLEALVRRPAPTLPGWWQRIGSALTAAVQQDGPALDLLCEDADADEDLWCGAVIRLLQALAGTADSLAAAQERFTALEAPVLAHWCLCLRVVRDSPPASGPLPAPLAEAARLGRALGARDVLDAVLRRQGRDGDGPARQAPVEDALPQPRDGGPLGPGPAPAPPRVHARLLGGFELTVDGVPVDLAHVRPRVRSLLHLLSLHAGTFVHRDVLADTLWPDVEAEAGQRGLQVAVSALRGLLEPGTPPRQTALLPRRGDAYGLMLPPGSGTDVQEFETALDHARQARRRGDAAAAMAAWRAALDAYRGDLLPEQGNADWVVQERDRLRLGAAGAAEALGRALRATGADDAALDAVRRALELDPFRDGVWRTLVELHETQGDRAAAQSARLQHRKVLAELGVPFDEA